MTAKGKKSFWILTSSQLQLVQVNCIRSQVTSDSFLKKKEGETCVAVALVRLLEVADVGLLKYVIAQWAFFGSTTRLSCWNNSHTGSGSEVCNKNEFIQFFFYERQQRRNKEGIWF